MIPVYICSFHVCSRIWNVADTRQVFDTRLCLQNNTTTFDLQAASFKHSFSYSGDAGSRKTCTRNLCWCGGARDQNCVSSLVVCLELSGTRTETCTEQSCVLFGAGLWTLWYKFLERVSPVLLSVGTYHQCYFH